MKRASYRHAIEHIALNDEDGSTDRLDAEVIAGYCTVVLVSDLFDVDQRRVARDVVRYREQRDARGAQRYMEAVTGIDQKATARLIAGLKRSQEK